MIGCREWLVCTGLLWDTPEHRVRVNYSRYPPIRGHWAVGYAALCNTEHAIRLPSSLRHFPSPRYWTGAQLIDRSNGRAGWNAKVVGHLSLLWLDTEMKSSVAEWVW